MYNCLGKIQDWAAQLKITLFCSNLENYVINHIMYRIKFPFIHSCLVLRIRLVLRHECKQSKFHTIKLLVLVIEQDTSLNEV